MKRKLRSPSEKARWLVDQIEKIRRARDVIDRFERLSQKWLKRALEVKETERS